VNLYDLFAIAGRRSPGKAALRMPARDVEGAEAGAVSSAAAIPAIEWSYGELLARTEGVVAGLRRHGIGPGDRVACLLGNGPELVLLHLALLRLGAILVPINLAYKRREIGHILADAAPRLLVVEAAQRAALDEVPAAERASLEAVLDAPELRRWSELELGAAASNGPAAGGIPEAPEAPRTQETPESPTPGGDDLALLLYTSGTTGTSKGAMISHNNVLATVTGLLAAWSWGAGDVLWLALPLFHVHGLIVGLDCALAAGATVELRRRFDAAAAAGALASGAVTVFFGVPTVYVRLVEEMRRRGADPAASSGVRLFCSGSAPLAPETFAAFRELAGQAILERYGMTECGMILSNPYLGPRLPGQVGTPLPGVSVRLVDEDGRDLPAGAEGELLVRGANVFGGYWQAPEKTAASFVQDAAGRRWFRTGDLARQDARTAAFTLLGRRHELIISGGFNIYPREVDETLLAFPGVREAAVVGRPHAEWGEVPIAYLVAEPALESPALLAYCKRQLAAFKVPHEVRLLDALPRNALGKLQKHLLP
jgi:malonyl-CoA/methylmalonyl-CoA synthetase